MLYLLIPLILVYQVFPLNLRCYIPSLHSLYYSTTLIHTPYQSIVYQVFPLNLRCCIVSQCRRDEMRIMTIRNWLVPPPPLLIPPLSTHPYYIPYCQHAIDWYPLPPLSNQYIPLSTHCYYTLLLLTLSTHPPLHNLATHPLITHPLTPLPYLPPPPYSYQLWTVWYYLRE